MPLTRFIFIIGFLVSSLAARTDTLPVAIYSRVAPSYEREIGPDGKPKREHYAIGYGGRIDGTLWDQTQQKEDFPEIAGIIAEELAKQNYYFSPDKETADLLIIIHWGRTNPTNAVNFSEGINQVSDALSGLDDALSSTSSDGAFSLVSEGAIAQADAQSQLDSAMALLQMENRVQQQRDEDTARVIGYTDELRRNNDIARFAGSDRFDTLLNEVQDPRYYVVVSAYDFAEITQREGKKKPLPRWVTRFSIRTRDNNFMDRVEQMALKAGGYFGRDSGRLIRDYRGEVEIGDLQVVSSSEAPPTED